MSAPSIRTKAADMLLRAKVIDREQHSRIVASCNETGERSEEVMLSLGIMSEVELLKALSLQYRTQFVSTDKLAKAEIPKGTIHLIPRKVAETLCVFPVKFDGERHSLSIVTPDPDGGELLQELKIVSGAREVKAFVSRPLAVLAAIAKHHGNDGRAFAAIEASAHMGGGRGYDPMDYGNRNSSGKRASAAPAAMEIERTQSIAQTQAAAAKPPPPPSPTAAPTQAFMIPQAALGGMGGQQMQPMHMQMQGQVVAPQMAAAIPAHALGMMPMQQSMQQNAPITLDIMLPEHPTAQRPVLQPPPAPPTPQPLLQPPAMSPTRTTQSGASEGPTSGRANNVRMTHMNKQLAEAKENARDTTVELCTVLVSLLENGRAELRGHSPQVGRLMVRIGERMGLEKEALYAFNVTALIHDVGKMTQFHLTALNVAEYDGHKVAAEKTHDTPSRLLESVGFADNVQKGVFSMYERFDGKGFPEGLTGKEIPLEARVLAVCDTYNDLTQNSRNPFRKTLSQAEALEAVQKHAGTVFDPSIVDVLKVVVSGDGVRQRLLSNRHNALIVDADPEETTVLSLKMTEHGFDVKIARNFEAARNMIRAASATDDGAFDLVLSELQGSDGNGLDFFTEARKEPWGKEVPWVFYARKHTGKDAQRAFALGAMDFVTKPVSGDVLVAKLKALLEQVANSRGSKGVSGSLKEMGIADLIQMLFNGRKTGKLSVRSTAGETGEIHVQNGDVVHAILGKKRGTDAFYSMLRFKEGDFGLDPSFVPTMRVIDESSESLLLEAMRRMDEGLA